MAGFFNKDFQEFIQALNDNGVAYMLVGGYAVILHGYVRSTGDMDIWVNKTEENYWNLAGALTQFGAPILPVTEFLGNEFDVWGFGIEPNRIEIMNEVKGVEFNEAYTASELYPHNDVTIRFIGFDHLLKAKEAAGRFKDKNDLEQLRSNI